MFAPDTKSLLKVSTVTTHASTVYKTVTELQASTVKTALASGSQPRQKNADSRTIKSV